MVKKTIFPFLKIDLYLNFYGYPLFVNEIINFIENDG